MSIPDLREKFTLDANQRPIITPFPIDIAIDDAIRETGHVLNMGDWHGDMDDMTLGEFCGTTHCRAGWAVALHPQGRALEKRYGPANAANLIYRACSVRDVVPSWFDSDAVARRDIERCAQLQRAKLAVPTCNILNPLANYPELF
jgi:hypothetical protein